jgi:hypothetical protein
VTDNTIVVLADHNLEGQAQMLWKTLESSGWLELYSLPLIRFAELGLPENSNDRQVWRFAQPQGMILLTGNRRMTGEDSLEQTLREENTLTSLPVLTIGDLNRMVESKYRNRCMDRLLDIVLDLENYRGIGRIFIP